MFLFRLHHPQKVKFVELLAMVLVPFTTVNYSFHFLSTMMFLIIYRDRLSLNYLSKFSTASNSSNHFTSKDNIFVFRSPSFIFQCFLQKKPFLSKTIFSLLQVNHELSKALEIFSKLDLAMLYDHTPPKTI